MASPSLLVRVDHRELLADVRPDKFDEAAVRWHGRLELEAAVLTTPSRSLRSRRSARYGPATRTRPRFCDGCYAVPADSDSRDWLMGSGCEP